MNDEQTGTCPKCGDVVRGDSSGVVCMSGCYLSSADRAAAMATPPTETPTQTEHGFLWDVYVPVAVSYRIVDHEALDAAVTAELTGGEVEVEAAPWQDVDRENNVWGPWQPSPDEDPDDTYAWQRDHALDARAASDVARAFTALQGLIQLHQTHKLGRGRNAPTSAADQCADLYSLLERLGLTVP